mgnify:CR=1 FL=1
MGRQLYYLNRRGQTSVEFFFLLVFVIFLMTILLSLFAQNLEQQQEIRDQVVIERLAGAWQTEIGLASSGPQEYERVFQIPKGTAGHPIYTRFGNDERNISDEIVFTFRNKDHLRFLPETVGYEELASDNKSILPFQIRMLRECYDSTCQLWLSNGAQEVKRPSRLSSNTVYQNVTNFSQFDNIHTDYPYILGSTSGALGIYNIETDQYWEDTSPSLDPASYFEVRDGVAFVGFPDTNRLSLRNISAGLPERNNLVGSAFVEKGSQLYVMDGVEFSIFDIDGHKLTELYRDTDIRNSLPAQFSSSTAKTLGLHVFDDYIYVVRQRNSNDYVDIFKGNVSNIFSVSWDAHAVNIPAASSYPQLSSLEDTVLSVPVQGGGASNIHYFLVSWNGEFTDLTSISQPAVATTEHYMYTLDSSDSTQIHAFENDEYTVGEQERTLTYSPGENVLGFNLFDEGYIVLTTDILHIYQQR